MEVFTEYREQIFAAFWTTIQLTVFSAIGATAPPTYENAGHNNNLSFIVTGDGVIWIDMEGRLRDAADRFDLERVETVLRAVADWVL